MYCNSSGIQGRPIFKKDIIHVKMQRLHAKRSMLTRIVFPFDVRDKLLVLIRPVLKYLKFTYSYIDII